MKAELTCREKNNHRPVIPPMSRLVQILKNMNRKLQFLHQIDANFQLSLTVSLQFRAFLNKQWKQKMAAE